MRETSAMASAIFRCSRSFSSALLRSVISRMLPRYSTLPSLARPTAAVIRQSISVLSFFSSLTAKSLTNPFWLNSFVCLSRSAGSAYLSLACIFSSSSLV